MIETTDKNPTTGIPRAEDQGVVTTIATVQHIAGSADYPLFVQNRVLPQDIDDVERDYGFDIYDKMHNDAMLSGVTLYLKGLILQHGMAIVPCLSKPNRKADPKDLADYENAEWAANFARLCVARLRYKGTSMGLTMWRMLDCIFKGHRLAEVTYEPLVGTEYSQYDGFQSIKVKPRQNYAFVMDRNNNVRGIMAKIPGVSISIWRGMIWDASKVRNVLAPEKVWTLTMPGTEDTPLGRSLYRAAYDPWWRKNTFKPEQVKSGVQFAGGMVTAELGESTPGEIDGVKTTTHVANQLAQLRNGAVGVTPNGVKVMVHQPPTGTSYFDTSIDGCNREMITAVIASARAVMESKHGSKADTGEAQDTVDVIVKWFRSLLCDSFATVLYNLICLNRGEAFAQKYCPVATMDATSATDFADNLSAIAGTGWKPTKKHLDEFDSRLGLTPRSEMEEDEAEEIGSDPETDSEDGDEADPAEQEAA